MENVIIYQTYWENCSELHEYLQNLGYQAKWVHSKQDLVQMQHRSRYSKLFVEISSLSDILLVSSLRHLYPNSEITLITSPNLSEIIKILQENELKTTNEITDGLVAIRQGD
jgi:hypothetical protein